MKLYNDDCFNLIKDIKDVNLILTDPPYEIADKGGGMMKHELHNKFMQEINDLGISKNFDVRKFLDLTLDCFNEKELYNSVYFCSRLQLNDYLNFAIDNKLQYGILVWHKSDPPPLCNNKYLNDLEFIIYIKGNKSKIYGDYSTKSLMYSGSINRKDKELYGHPTIKPKELVEKFVINHSRQGDLVFDPFAGTGTTGVVCGYTKRKFVGIEKDKKWFGVAKNRIENNNQQSLEDLF